MPGFIEGDVAVWSADGTEANTAVGIVLNKFKGFVRLRLLERKPDANDDASDTHAYVMALPVDCFPVHECSKADVHVSEEDMGDEPDIERTDAVIQVPSEAKEVAFFVARNRTTSARLPAPGTLERVFQASSPTPASRCPAPFVLKESELCEAGLASGTLGVFATQDLPKGYYAGELLGETGWNVETFEDAGHRHVWPVSRKPTHCIDTGVRLRHLSKKEKLSDYIDSQDPDTSSFLRFVNAALPGVLVSKVGATGYGNCDFVQMQERVYLRTTAKVPAGKELLAPAPNNPTPAGVMPVPNRQTERSGKAKALAVLSDSDSEDDEDIERKSRRSSTSSQQSLGSGSGAPNPPRAKRARVDDDEKKAAARARAEKAAATRQRKKEEEEAEKAAKAKKKKAGKAEKAAAAAAAKKAISNKKLAAAAVAAKPLPPPPPSASPQVRKTRAPPRVCDALSSTRVRDVELPVPTAVDRIANDQYVHKSHFNEMKRRAKEAESVANHHLVKASQWEAAYNRQVAKTDIAESKLRLIQLTASQKENK